MRWGAERRNSFQEKMRSSVLNMINLRLPLDIHVAILMS